MFFKLDKVKRKKTCSLCKDKLESEMLYFNFFDWRKGEMPYPINQNICFNCAFEISNPDFLAYLTRLISCLKTLRKNVQINARNMS